jgi:predicted O-methyltransferase YrrM
VEDFETSSRSRLEQEVRAAAVIASLLPVSGTVNALRTRIVRFPPVARVRSGAALVASPIARRLIARTDHATRLRCVRLLLPGSHGQRPSEILAFAEFAAARNPHRVCEIGTLTGGTSLFLTGLSPSVRQFVGIDVKIHNARVVAALAPSAVDVVHIEGSSREVRVRDGLIAALDGNPLDLLFIDGDHEYQGAKADLIEYRDLVAPGGLIAFHDIVQDHSLNFWSGGVPRLWREIREHFSYWEFVDDPSQDAFGIGVIEHDPEVGIDRIG